MYMLIKMFTQFWIILCAMVTSTFATFGMQPPPNEFWYDGRMRPERPIGGQGCMYNQLYFDIDEVFLLGDGCNTCVCDAYDHMTCTLLDCAHYEECAFNGQPYDIFGHWPLGIGCQTCHCDGVEGFISCQLQVC